MTRWAREAEWDSLFAAAAAAQASRAGVTPEVLMDLVKAHAGVESGFSPTAYHWDGPDAVRNVSRGLMQIEGATAQAAGLDPGDDSDTLTGPDAPRDYAETTVPSRTTGMYDPAQAIPFATNIEAGNLARNGGNLPETIAAYNEGEGGAQRDLPAGTFRDQAYVDRVQDAFAYFQAQRASGAEPAAPGPAGASSLGGLALAGGVVGLLVLLLVFLRL